MFYTGGDFAPLDPPAGLPGAPAEGPLEGLRMRPGLAMSQVRPGPGGRASGVPVRWGGRRRQKGRREWLHVHACAGRAPGARSRCLGDACCRRHCPRSAARCPQDGRNWARIEGEHHTGALFDVGEPGEWDALFIGHPCVVAAGPRDMRMFYHSYDASKGR